MSNCLSEKQNSDAKTYGTLIEQIKELLGDDSEEVTQFEAKFNSIMHDILYSTTQDDIFERLLETLQEKLRSLKPSSSA